MPSAPNSDQQALLQRALAQLSLPLPQQIVPLTGGLSNQSWRLHFAQHPSLIWRWNTPQECSPVNRALEVECWRSAEQAGLAPQLRWVDPQYRCYLSEALNIGADWSSLDSAATGIILIDQPERALLNLLQKLITLPLPSKTVGLAQQWSEYAENLKLQRQCLSAGDKPFFKEWIVRFNKINQLDIGAMLAALESCLLQPQYCHRDLNAHNLLWVEANSGAASLRCIDFEYACAGHPLFELAVVLLNHRLNTQQQQWLAQGYLHQHPNLTAQAEAQLPAAKQLYWLFSCCWALLMAAGQQQQREAGEACKEQRAYLHWFDQFANQAGI